MLRSSRRRRLVLAAAAGALLLPLLFARLAAADDASVVEWITRSAKPFDTCVPCDDHRDLASLRRIVGDARVVALGECTVGTREFVQLKQRIVEYLASEMGFTTVALDANMPEAKALDDYIQTGTGDPRARLSGLKYWPLATEEMLGLVAWMRDYNASGHARHLRLAGFDMLKPDVPAEVVGRFLRRVDPAWADTLEAVSSAIGRARRTGGSGQSAHARGEFPAADAAGHRVRLSGWIRTRDVSGYAGLYWGAYAEGGLVAFDNMEHQQLKGTRDWQRYALELDVPAHVDRIEFGPLLVGTGAAWFDSLGIELDGKAWRFPGRLDLDFESAANPVGFDPKPGPGYDIRMDDSTAASGRRSLRLSSVPDFVPPNPAMLWAEAEKRAERLARRFEEEAPRYRAAASSEEASWASRNAQLLLQRTRYPLREAARDSSKAANLRWIMERQPKGSRIVIWSHNSTIARTGGSMGDWLAKTLGKDMVVIGFATNEGLCTTTRTTSANLEATPIQPGPDGSFEALAHASGLPRFLLDLRRARPGSRVAAQLRDGLTLRSIGVATPTQEFWPTSLSREYDAIAWVGKTQATRALELH